MKKLAVAVVALVAAGCATYQSNYEADPKRPLEAYSGFVLDHESNQDQSGETVLIETLRGIGLDQKGYFDVKNIDAEGASATLVAWWGVTNLQPRVMATGYSQEVTVILKDGISDEPVYIGVGEYMGLSHGDDIAGAMKRALSGVASYAGFNPVLARQLFEARGAVPAQSSFPAPGEDSRSVGTCFAVGPDGHVLTSHHVIAGASKIYIDLSDGRRRSADLVTESVQTDLALLKVDAVGIDYLPLSEMRSARVGMDVFTMGFPATGILGFDPKFTDGTVSSLSGIQGESSLIQVTVPMQPGNSGGPLVNDSGEVVGIVTSTAAVENFFSQTGSLPQNVNWAVKSDYARLLFDPPPAVEKADSRSQAIDMTKRAICRVEAE